MMMGYLVMVTASPRVITCSSTIVRPMMFDVFRIIDKETGIQQGDRFLPYLNAKVHYQLKTCSLNKSITYIACVAVAFH